MGEPWTLPQVREVLRRQHAGETVAEIARDMGRTPAALRGALRRHAPGEGPGRGAGGGATLAPERAKAYRLAIRMRRAGRTWEEAAEAVDIDIHPASLASCTLAYADRVGFDLREDRAPELRVGRVERGTCRIRDCERPARRYRRGLCGGCYRRARQAGVLENVAAPDGRYRRLGLADVVACALLGGPYGLLVAHWLTSGAT